MKISGYENIEIFNKTQGFGINKYENQILRDCRIIYFMGQDHTYRGLFYVIRTKEYLYL